MNLANLSLVAILSVGATSVFANPGATGVGGGTAVAPRPVNPGSALVPGMNVPAPGQGAVGDDTGVMTEFGRQERAKGGTVGRETVGNPSAATVTNRLNKLGLSDVKALNEAKAELAILESNIEDSAADTFGELVAESERDAWGTSGYNRIRDGIRGVNGEANKTTGLDQLDAIATDGLEAAGLAPEAIYEACPYMAKLARTAGRG